MGRDEIMRRFEKWLDDVLSSEEPPNGVDAQMLAAATGESAEEDGRCDSYAMWAAMTALTQEVKLQGRAFKELHDALGGEAGRMAAEIRAAYGERERVCEREAEHRCRKEILDALLDLRDRLGRGIKSVRAGEAAVAGRSGWLARIFRRSRQDHTAEVLTALHKGYALAMERLDQMLDEFHAREIPCRGQSFDPRRMNVVDKEESSTLPEGTVLEVYRSGYEWNGEIYRPAQVKVSCAPMENQK